MRHSRLPIFRLTSISIAVGAALLQGCASSSSSKDYAVPNPYVVTDSNNKESIHINTLRAFGDSYTDANFSSARGVDVWASQLANMTSATTTQNYAIGGARAASVNYKSFNRQLDTMESKGLSTFADGDLTAVYFGYNDVGKYATADALANPRAHYTQGVQRLIKMGAATDNRRIFVTQLQDWSKAPAVEDGVRTKVLFWNQFVADLANQYQNVIAVDLFTPFERIYENPEKYGFTNVSTADSARSATDALYNDTSHFGTRGNTITARVFYHYLTRGWDWANTLQAGTETAQKLNSDIDRGLIKMFNQSSSPISSSWNIIPIGTPTQKPSLLPTSAFSNSATAIKNRQLQGNELQRDNAPSGVAFDYSGGKLDSEGRSARYGFALTQSDVSNKLQGLEDRNQNRLTSSASTAYWQQPVGGFLVTTQMSHHDLSYSNSANDDILARSVTNSGKGNVWSLESKVRHPFSTGNFLITPWASLTTYRQKLDAYNAQTLYTVDTRYTMNTLTDVYAGIGFDVQSRPFDIGRGMELSFGGGLSHSATTYRSAATVAMTEVERNFTQSEALDRSRIQRTMLGLNADLAVSRNVNLTASYAAKLQDVKGTQTISIRANVAF